MEHMAVFHSSGMAISTLKEDPLQIMITFVQMMTGQLELKYVSGTTNTGTSMLKSVKNCTMILHSM